MKKKLEQGTTLIVDRYAFSGVAFTSAKPVSHLLAFQTCASIRPNYNVCLGGAADGFTCSSSPGFLSGLVHEAWRGTAEAGPCHVPSAQPSRSCSQRPVWRREIWDQCLPASGSTEVWTADEGSFSQLAGGCKAEVDRRFICGCYLNHIKHFMILIVCRRSSMLLRVLTMYTRTSRATVLMPSTQLRTCHSDSCGSDRKLFSVKLFYCNIILFCISMIKYLKASCAHYTLGLASVFTTCQCFV